MIEQLEGIDRDIFLFLNGLHHEMLDPVMYLVSHKLFWVPFYLLIFYLVQRKYGWQTMGMFALGVAVVVLFCDQLSSGFFKPLFARARPCNNIEIMDIIHRVNGRCGRGFSFISGHATNYFGLAMFCGFVVGDKRFHLLLIAWAAIIAYSRIYLGVHYPSDIMAGAVLGSLIGTGVFYGFNRLVLNRKVA